MFEMFVQVFSLAMDGQDVDAVTLPEVGVTKSLAEKGGERRATAIRLIRLLGRNAPCQGQNVFRALEVSYLTEESNYRRHASHSLVVQPRALAR
jgi:hypothetical protein